MPRPKRPFASAVLILSSLGPAFAQTPTADPDSGQVVGLFQQACVKYAGNPSGLRTWIAAHGLPEVPSAQAAPFLGSIGAGEVFGASTASGKHALVSYDDGACAVIALAGRAADIQQTLLALLRAEGVTVKPIAVRAKPDGSSRQMVFEAAHGTRTWELSVTSMVHQDQPGLPPEVKLLATPG